MRSLFVTVLGLCACGDSFHPLRDAGPADSPNNPDAAQSDAAIPPDAFVDTDTSLMLRYDFEDSSTTVRDVSSKGKNGTVSTADVYTAEGRNGRGIKLVNVSPATQYVSIPGGVLTGVTEFTIATWVKFDSFADFARIWDLGNGPIPGAQQWMFLTVLGNEGFHSAIFGGPPDGAGSHENIVLSGTVANATNSLPTGVWKHVAVTGSGGDQRIYVDGVLAGSVTGGPVVPISSLEPLENYSWLGRSRFDNDQFHDPGLNGSLDDFRIYNRVLTDTQIADLAWPKKDYSYWRFDETAGQIAKDSSDNMIATALTNGPTWVAGKHGNALDFAGGATGTNSQYVVLATSPLADCDKDLTVATWIKLHSQDNWARVIDLSAADRFMFIAPFDDRDPTTPGGPRQHGLHFGMTVGDKHFDMFTQTPPIPGDDTWHHIAVTVVNNTDVTFYVDGASVLTQQNSLPADIKVSDFKATTQNWLGRSMFPDAFLHGALDELRISCRAYTRDEIKTLAHP